ncbi:MAG: DMT family transporter [Burkholderiaceae bacterium]|jgi:drug/metabolite transporter (DMT)-like permease|nr:DMT family transporter [Burkholderiaceae bacterium]
MHSPLPVFALLFNAFVWGLTWWPFRHMFDAGLHPLWATAVMYAMVLTGLLLFRPGILRQIRDNPGLWVLALSSGLNNVAFNWAITIGDVVRVILLFYLMPAWAILLAWKVLGERPTPTAIARLLLAFCGVFLVIWPKDGGLARLFAALSLADWLALFGGFMFAFTNVTLRRMHRTPGQARMFSMFGGCMLTALAAAFVGGQFGLVPQFPAPNATWVTTAVLLAMTLAVGNWALQYGASRLAASVTAVVMLSEVAFASVSSVLLGAAQLDARSLLGGALILMAAAWSAWPRKVKAPPASASPS